MQNLLKVGALRNISLSRFSTFVPRTQRGFPAAISSMSQYGIGNPMAFSNSGKRSFHTSMKYLEDHPDDETYEHFQERYMKAFRSQNLDMFELTRLLNNAFSTDILMSPEVIAEGLRATRRLNSMALAARVLEALKQKVGSAGQGGNKVYEEYMAELKPVIDELGIPTPEELGR